MTCEASIWPVKLRVTGARAETLAPRAAIIERIVIVFIFDGFLTEKQDGG
jgi:hypothetical protein